MFTAADLATRYGTAPSLVEHDCGGSSLILDPGGSTPALVLIDAVRAARRPAALQGTARATAADRPGQDPTTTAIQSSTHPNTTTAGDSQPGAQGRTPLVRRSGNRFSVNAMAVISAKGRMHFMVFTETFDADVMCRFLDRLATASTARCTWSWTYTPHTAPAKSAPGSPTTPTASNCTSCRRTRRS